jgi:hypothetical protein
MGGSGSAAGALGVISAMVTPALVRMARVVDRARALAAVVHEGRIDRLGATAGTVRRWLSAHRSRAWRTALAVSSLYAAIVLFVGACLIIGFQHLGAALPDWAPLACVLPGTLLLLGGAVWMASETHASQMLVLEEIDNALSRLDKEASP